LTSERPYYDVIVRGVLQLRRFPKAVPWAGHLVSKSKQVRADQNPGSGNRSAFALQIEFLVFFSALHIIYLA
jgi:hypothetical protein